MDFLELILELGKEYGWTIMLIALYIWDKRQDAKFYQNTIDKNFNEIDTTIESLQEQISLMLAATINYRCNNKEDGDQLIEETIDSYPLQGGRKDG
ncbi:MAG: hypothetical protein ACOCRK_06830 [bacterium]